MQNPLPHEARVILTGWASPATNGLSIGPFKIRTKSAVEGLQRLTITSYPRTYPDGALNSLSAKSWGIRNAGTQPNGSTFIVTGMLVRANRSSGVIQVKVCPKGKGSKPFIISAQATSEILCELSPDTFHVQMRGRVILAGNTGILLAEQVVPIYAPAPEQWRRHKTRRRLPPILSKKWGEHVPEDSARPAP